MRKCNFAFDLDATVLEAIDYDAENQMKMFKKELGEDFVKRHSITAYGYIHMVFPGFYELFKWLRDKGHEIMFYSSGIRARNDEAVKEIMIRTFGKYEIEKVFSREHLFNTNDLDLEDKEERERKIGLYYGNNKKKLEETVVPKEELPYTAMIDDDMSYSYGGEEKNFLVVRYGLHYYSDDPYDKNQLYFSFNKSSYVTGLLDTAFNEMEQNNITLVDSLYKLQVLNLGHKLGNGFYFPTREEKYYYEKGYEILKQINPDLKFFSM